MPFPSDLMQGKLLSEAHPINNKADVTLRPPRKITCGIAGWDGNVFSHFNALKCP